MHTHMLKRQLRRRLRRTRKHFYAPRAYYIYLYYYIIYVRLLQLYIYTQTRTLTRRARPVEEKTNRRAEERAAQRTLARRRVALKALFVFLLPPPQSPIVTNIAAMQIFPPDPRRHVEDSNLKKKLISSNRRLCRFTPKPVITRIILSTSVDICYYTSG